MHCPEDVRGAMEMALAEAKRFAGATSPNPPVGAAGLDVTGTVLSVRAHERAGLPHAEAAVIAECRANGTLAKLHTVVVTLEPCAHHGRTPPCTEALIEAGVRRVFFGARDPNPRVNGKGAERLRAAGIEVYDLSDPRARELIRGFERWVTTGRPWITIKRAFRADGSMIPPSGAKTFTSASSLLFAHELRRRADAILTGSGTVLADKPEFTVRHVPDHHGKRRILVVLDRRGRVSKDWLASRQDALLEVVVSRDHHEAFKLLAEKGCLEVLVEAGPQLSSALIEEGLWDEKIDVLVQPGGEDRIRIELAHERRA